MKDSISMAEIARVLGVHQTTVSRAFRTDSRIPKKTRDRILAKARELGYAPNPLVSALMETRRRRTPRKNFSSNIAYLVTDRTQSPESGSPLDVLYKSAEKRAGELGFLLAPLSVNDLGTNIRRMPRILNTRGICGIMVGPTPIPHDPILLPWSKYPVVAMGHWLQTPSVYRVATDHFNSVILAVSQCHKAGYRRVGFCLDSYDDERTNGLELGGYCAYQFRLPKSQRVPPLMMKLFEKAEVAAWVKKHDVDAIITSQPGQILDVLKAMKLAAPTCGIVAMGNNHPGFFARVERAHDEIGGLAAELLSRMIQRNQTGLPKHAGSYLISSRWIDGGSVGPLARPARQNR